MSGGSLSGQTIGGIGGGIRLSSLIAADPADLQAAGAQAGATYANAFVAQAQKILSALNKTGITPAMAGPGALAALMSAPESAAKAGASPAGLAGLAGSLGQFLSGGLLSSVGKLAGLLQNVGGLAGRSLAPLAQGLLSIGSAAGSAVASVLKLPAAFGGLSGVVNTVTSIAGAIDTYIVRPLASVGRYAAQAAEDSRAASYAMAASFGSLGRSIEVDSQLIARTKNSVESVASLRKAAESLGSLPGISGALSWSRDAETAASAIGHFADEARKLSVLRTGDLGGGDSALEAIRRLSAGGPTALRSLRAYGVTGQSLAREVSDRFNGDLKAAIAGIEADPVLANEALRKYLDSMIPDSAVSRYRNLLSSRVEHLSDALRASLSKLADGGILDSISSRLQTVTNQILDLWASPKFQQTAQRFSMAVGRIIDNVAAAIGKLLGMLSGGDGPMRTVSDFVSLVTSGVERLADLSDKLPSVAEKLSGWGRELAVFFADAVDSVRALVAELQHLSSLGLKGLIFGDGKPAAPAGPSWGAAARAYFLAQDVGATLPDFNISTPVKTDGIPDSVRRLLRAEDSGPAWGSRLQTLSTVLNRVGAPSDGDELAQLTRAASGALGANLSGDPRNAVSIGNIFEKMRADLDKTLSRFDSAIGTGRAALEANPSDALKDAVGRLTEQRAGIVARYQKAVESTADMLTTSAREYGEALAAGLQSASPLAASVLREKVAAGTTSYADKILSTLSAAGLPADRRSVGLQSLPVAEQERQVQAIIDARLKLAEQGGELGNLTVGMSADDIRAAFARRGSDRETTQAQIAYLQSSGLGQQEGVLSRALAAYNANPGSELAIRDAAEAETAYAKLLQRLDELQHKISDVQKAWADFGTAARDSLTSSLGSALAGLILQTGDVKSAVRALVTDIVNQFSQMQAKLLVQSLIGDAGKQNSNNQTNGIGGLLGGLLSLIGGGSGGGSANVATAAYATGGVATSPTIALIAEVPGAHEAVIPMSGGRIPLTLHNGELAVGLPGGRHVPAHFNGGPIPGFSTGGILGQRVPTYTGLSGRSSGTMPLAGSAGTVNTVEAQKDGDVGIYIVANTEEAVMRGMKRNSSLLIDTVVGSVSGKGGGKVQKAMKRTSFR